MLYNAAFNVIGFRSRFNRAFTYDLANRQCWIFLQLKRSILIF